MKASSIEGKQGLDSKNMDISLIFAQSETV